MFRPDLVKPQSGDFPPATRCLSFSAQIERAVTLTAQENRMTFERLERRELFSNSLPISTSPIKPMVLAPITLSVTVGSDMRITGTGSRDLITVQASSTSIHVTATTIHSSF